MAKKTEVYSVAAMLYSPSFKNSLEGVVKTSGIQKILNNPEDNLILCIPEDYHFTISYIEFCLSDWVTDIPDRIRTAIFSALADKNITLPFKRLAVIYKYFFAEYDMENLREFKNSLLVALQKEFPQGIFGFEEEYFPHITLARFNMPAEIPRIITRELIQTQIKNKEIQQPPFLPPLIINKSLELKIGVKVQESNFLA